MKVNDHLSVTFLLEKARPNSEGMLPISARITVDGTRSEMYIGQKIQPEFWDRNGKLADLKLHPNSKEAREINNAIRKCIVQIEQDYKILEEKFSYVTSELLKLMYKQGIDAVEKLIKNNKEEKLPHIFTLCQILNYKYSKFACLVKVGKRSPNTLKRWKSTKLKIRKFLHFKFKKWDVPVAEIRYSHADDFMHFLLTKVSLEENTARKYLKNTKELLQIAEDREIINKSPWARYRIGYDQPERQRLSMSHIITLYEKPLIERLDHVRNVFLFACFTGYSFQEVLNLKRDCIFTGIDGKRWIKIDRQKTGNPECLPLLPIPAAIIDRYENEPYCKANNKLLPVKSYHNYNGYLKEVGYICEIPIELSTHIARHTFATTICLDHDVPLETVSKLLGHKNLRTTQIYAQISDKKISNNMTELERKLFTSDGKLRVEVVSLNILSYKTTTIAV